MIMKRIPKICRILLIAAFWFFLWWGGSAIYGKPLLFPSPIDVFKKLIELAGTTDFYIIVANSILNVLLGLIVAIICGIFLAVLTSNVSFLRALLHPVMTVVKSTPVASFIILAYVLIGATKVPAFITFLIVVPIVWTNLDMGWRKIDPQLYEVTRVYRFSTSKRFRLLIIPSLSPYLISACRTSLGLAWKAGIAAEIITMPRNTIGVMIGNAKQYLETTEVFAWTLTVILLSLLIEFGFNALLKKLSNKIIVQEDGNAEI